MRLRRLRGLTCYWHRGDFVAHAYRGHAPVALHPSTAEILSAFDTWTTRAQAAEALDHLHPETVVKAAGTLLEYGLLAEEGSPEAEEDERLADTWGPWSPEASFFHYATRDVPFETATPELRQHLTRDGRPALFTEYPEADRILLPRTPDPRLSAPLEQTLYRRRTHRSFSAQPVSLHDLAVLLRTVFGPAEFIDGFEYGALIRRTSPPAEPGKNSTPTSPPPTSPASPPVCSTTTPANTAWNSCAKASPTPKPGPCARTRRASTKRPSSSSWSPHGNVCARSTGTPAPTGSAT